MIGVTQIGPRQFDTTGVLGASDVDGVPHAARLSRTGRRCPARNGWPWAGSGISPSPGCSSSTALLFLAWAIARGHVKRDLLPTEADFTHLPREIVDHLRLKFPKGEDAKRYNALQKLAYFVVIFGWGP